MGDDAGIPRVRAMLTTWSCLPHVMHFIECVWKKAIIFYVHQWGLTINRCWSWVFCKGNLDSWSAKFKSLSTMVVTGSAPHNSEENALLYLTIFNKNHSSSWKQCHMKWSNLYHYLESLTHHTQWLFPDFKFGNRPKWIRLQSGVRWTARRRLFFLFLSSQQPLMRTRLPPADFRLNTCHLLLEIRAINLLELCGK